MAIKRYKADADNTITNSFRPGFKLRGTGSNTGLADVLEVFSIYGRETSVGVDRTSGSQELTRVLIQFPVNNISSDRTAGTVPVSGSVSFYLRMFNAETSKTVPKEYKLTINPISQSWQEGDGLDLENFSDLTYGNEGSNWMSASNSSKWTSVGGDVLTSSSDYLYEQTFESGLEDLEVDVTPLVENWIAGTINNYGMLVKLSSSYEGYFSNSSGVNSGSVIQNPDGATKSYYTKRFFARGTQYFFKRPVIEARWNNVVDDDRGYFFYSSSLAPAEDNLNTIYLYNYVRGQLVNIPSIGTGNIFVSLYSGSSSPTGGKLTLYDGNTRITGGYVSTGIYSCSVAITAASTPLDTLFDVWHSGSVEYFTGSITPQVLTAAQTVSKPVYYLNITNLLPKYRSDQTARFNLYIRNKNWSPTIYTVANTNPPTTTIESASYRVFRTLDGYEAIPHGTGSDLHTLLSHDVSGNYFDFDMELLEPGYEYAFRFAFYDPSLSSWSEQRETFKFRVEEYEY
tara:strand:+ start:1318 stop:2853 length:1536 start_codon:yes stop_codon:yes gene_type:complete